MRKCKVIGCKREHRALGFCSNHYMQWRRKSIARNNQEACKVTGCDRLKYSKEMCFKHYRVFQRMIKKEKT